MTPIDTAVHCNSVIAKQTAHGQVEGRALEHLAMLMLEFDDPKPVQTAFTLSPFTSNVFWKNEKNNPEIRRHCKKRGNTSANACCEVARNTRANRYAAVKWAGIEMGEAALGRQIHARSFSFTTPDFVNQD